MPKDNTKKTKQPKDVKVLIMSGYGINCETESAHAFELAGASPKIVHVNDLISGKARMKDFDILMFSGGFSYGDDTGSGQAFAGKMRNNLWDELLDFIRSGKLVLGVCNGFQVMVHLGLFPTPDSTYGEKNCALEANDSARYVCRWVGVSNEMTDNTICVFTKDIKSSHLPVAHGEGRFFCDKETFEALRLHGQIVFRYCDDEGRPARGRFPYNPNGAVDDIAGICDKTGRVMGMMPHPERALYHENEPDYHLKKESGLLHAADDTGKNLPEEGLVRSNFMIFKNAVEYFGKR